LLDGAPVPVAVVPNGVDVEEFPVVTPAERAQARAEFGVPAGGFVVAFIGDYTTPRKGLGVLLDAVGKGPANEYLLVAGRGHRVEVSARASALAIAGRVRLLGVVPARDVLAAADVVAVPSWYEPFSLVALEAAARGIPAVVSAAAGAAAILGEAAVVFAPGDAGQLRLAIDEVREHPGRAGQRATVARGIAETLRWDAVTEQAARVIEDVASGA
jgi:glycosyltransferase involved in cell wall biosynthesis